MEEIFIGLSLVLILAIIISILIKILKQPLIIAYILTGLIAGPLFLDIIKDKSIISIFSQFGVSFLLFIVGLHMTPKIIKEVGKVSIFVGLAQIIFTSVIGYFIGIMLGFSPLVSLYIAISLTFSSTIIIMKILSDKEDLEKLYGKISIGILIIQDIIAIIILIIISSFSNHGGAVISLVKVTISGLIAILFFALICINVLPKFKRFFSKSSEFLFIFSISWGLGLSVLFLKLGFTFEVGALIAGVLLAFTPYNYEVSSKLKPLRDFFIVSFFILLGTQLTFTGLQNYFIPIIVFSFFVLIGNPLIVMIVMGFLGYSKKTSFNTGLTVAQISEFSLILITLGVTLGHLPSDLLSPVTMIGLITIAGSSYLMINSDKLFNLLSRYLTIFEKRNIHEKEIKEKNYEYILLGYNRIGFSILKSFAKLKKKFLVVDYDPDIVKKLTSKKIDALYGDVDDIELLDEIKIHKAKLVLSTIPDIDTNLSIISKVRQSNDNCIILVTCRQINEAFKLYSSGADYVILPHFLGGEYTAKMIEKIGNTKKSYEKEKKEHLKELRERYRDGQEHPKTDREVR